MAETQQQLVARVYAAVRGVVATKTITPAGAIRLIEAAMSFIERLPALDGAEKKRVVLDVVECLLGELPADQEDAEAVRAAVRLLAPSIIDGIVSAASGATGINAPPCCAPLRRWLSGACGACAAWCAVE